MRGELLRKKRYWLFSLLLIPFFALVERTSLREVSRPSPPPKNLQLLELVFRYIRNDYIEEVDPTKVVEGAFRGLTNSLDSCSGYLDHKATARYLAQRQDQPAEPGLVLFKKGGGFPTVVGINENSPAEKVGIRLGDTITEINGQSTSIMSLAETNLLLRGKEDEPIKLKVLRDEKTLEIKVGRLNLKDPAFYSRVEATGGILRIARFKPPLLTILRKDILPRLRFSDKPLILDLRTCQEGTFEEARQFINLFLKSDSIGYLEKAGGKRDPLPALAEPLLPNVPLLVWISQATLGPAEAVAAILKEKGRAKIVGLPTLGLAGQNEFFPLPDGTSLLLTTGVFSLQSGAKLCGQGVEPDVYVEVEDLSSSAYLKKSISLLTGP